MNKLKQAELKFYQDLLHSPKGLPASRAGKSWNIETFIQLGAIEYTRRGSGGIYTAIPDQVRKVLKVHFEITDLDSAVAFDNTTRKGEIALAAGHTKAVNASSTIRHIGVRACATTPVTLTHGARSLEISPIKNVLVRLPIDFGNIHVFKAPPATVAVICENKEDFLSLTPDILHLLLREPDCPALLFSRDDGILSITQMVDRLGISKLYHYGDFDLCGVQIFESSTLKYAPHAKIASPEEAVLEDMIKDHGSRSLFNKQFDRTRGFSPISEEGQKIAQIIRKHRKVIEQETVNQLLSSIE